MLLNPNFFWYVPRPRPTPSVTFPGVTDIAAVKECYPFTERTGLFLDFAKTLSIADIMKETGPSFDETAGQVEAEHAVAELTFYVCLWETLNNRAEFDTKFDKFVTIDEDHYSVFRPTAGLWYADHLVEQWDISHGLEPNGHVDKFAEFVLHEIIGKHLNEECKVAPVLVDKKVELQFTPISFAGALWAQFAEAVVKGYSFSECTQCGNWYRMKTRRSTKYCSHRCKMRKYRQVVV